LLPHGGCLNRAFPIGGDLQEPPPAIVVFSRQTIEQPSVHRRDSGQRPEWILQASFGRHYSLHPPDRPLT
jgi:hypothetical protein